MRTSWAMRGFVVADGFRPGVLLELADLNLSTEIRAGYVLGIEGAWMFSAENAGSRAKIAA